MNSDGETHLAGAIRFLEHAVMTGPVEALPRIMADLEFLRVTAEMKIRNGIPARSNSPSSVKSRYLTVQEVIERFHVPAKWLYRHKRQMPYSQPSRKILLFPEEAITKWFATRNRS